MEEGRGGGGYNRNTGRGVRRGGSGSKRRSGGGRFTFYGGEEGVLRTGRFREE